MVIIGGAASAADLDNMSPWGTLGEAKNHQNQQNIKFSIHFVSGFDIDFGSSLGPEIGQKSRQMEADEAGESKMAARKRQEAAEGGGRQ